MSGEWDFATAPMIGVPATCETCGQVMLVGPGCTSDAAYLWGAEPYWRGRLVDWRCRDCGTPPGERHHPGCCVAACRLGCRNPDTPTEPDQAAFCRHRHAYSVAVH